MAAPIQVLHVDDPEVTRSTRAFLEDGDRRFAVETARSASDALDRLDSTASEPVVDCVVSGYDIGAVDGLELLERVRERHSDLPFVLFTGERSEEVASEAISRDVDAYLEKRLETQQYVLLQNRVERAVEGYRARDRVERLHQASRVFMRARSRKAVCEKAVDAIGGILGFPLSGVWLLDEDGPALRPVAVSESARDLFQSIPVYTPGNSLSWQAYESGEAVFYRAIDEHPEAYDPDTPVQSELILPLGGHGVINVGSTREREISDIDRSLADLLAANVEAALDRAAREEAQVRSERRFRTLFDQSVDALFLHTGDGEVVEVNDRACDLLGFDRNALVGQSIWDIEEDESRAELRTLWEEMGPDDVREIETVYERVDGSAVPVEVRVGRIDAPGDAEFFAAARDVSRQRERERELQRQNERLEEFAGVVSHDLRNPLHVAQGRLNVAMKECDSDHLEVVADAHERMERLIDDLLTLAREGDTVAEPSAVSVGTVAEDSWESVRTGDASLVVDSGRTIAADPERLRRLFENLFRNSVEHGSPGGRTEADDAGEPDESGVTVTVGDTADGFFVGDDGSGIPPEKRDRVFESTYTTSEEGTGFGLSIVQQIAQAHGWEVTLRSGTDGGARFEFSGVDEV
ncbi:MAG: PAS domain S-box protein [Haloarculaceae archaeon]